MTSKELTTATASRVPEVIPLDDAPKAEARAMANIESSRAMQEVTASILAAKRFPRDEVAAQKKILAACTRPTLAQKAVYSYPRGGEQVSGPSIRLAEVLAQYWGNLKYGWQEIERRGNESIVRAYCWDKETNMDAEITFTVKQVRDKWDNYGKPNARKIQVPITEERDIYENNANQAARRKRACILALIPGDIIESAVEECEKTLVTKEPMTKENLDGMLKAFAGFGVNKKMIEDYIGRTFESIVPAQVVKFKSIYNSLNDGMAKVEDYFDVSLRDKKDDPKKEAAKPESKAAEQKEEKKPAAEKFKEKHAPKAEPNDEKKPCETCVGTGILHENQDGVEVKGPCPDCKGEGKV